MGGGYKGYKGLLQLAVLILPLGQRVLLLADSGFVHAGLVKFARAHQRGFRLRAKSNTLVRLNGYHYGPALSTQGTCPLLSQRRCFGRADP